LGRPRLAIWGTSLLFAAIHMNLIVFIPLLVLALILIFVYEKTDRLIAPIMTHSLFNAVNFLFSIFQPNVTEWLHRLWP
jgi:hypothetical protein